MRILTGRNVASIVMLSLLAGATAQFRIVLPGETYFHVMDVDLRKDWNAGTLELSLHLAELDDSRERQTGDVKWTGRIASLVAAGRKVVPKNEAATQQDDPLDLEGITREHGSQEAIYRIKSVASSAALVCVRTTQLPSRQHRRRPIDAARMPTG